MSKKKYRENKRIRFTRPPMTASDVEDAKKIIADSIKKFKDELGVGNRKFEEFYDEKEGEEN